MTAMIGSVGLGSAHPRDRFSQTTGRELPVGHDHTASQQHPNSNNLAGRFEICRGTAASWAGASRRPILRGPWFQRVLLRMYVPKEGTSLECHPCDEVGFNEIFLAEIILRFKPEKSPIPIRILNPARNGHFEMTRIDGFTLASI